MSKIKNDLEYRMYGFVPYNLSPIQQGIQFGHAVVEVVVFVVVVAAAVVVVTQPLFPVGQAYISYVVPVSELDILSTP